ncbi:LeuD/DmdB family oxidoreductase small subunit [Picrophilus oshimae]|uniref:3-isopropylmalate dehydratase n=1 Tax=Picrophilus torridus (strain ATCC 700027 / DSM 9790 / JCM 10055 / NBRC 100828 / KAW 2/3) TaxID=1122961 RepID=Q6KZ02_PICTO|nr:3-isopropylmalate dehydratase [Picrophilus oshimae]AAT44050.1 3-isopropylmalate dehydratase [Picrophilus oshimae DSM 9789]SMD30879.1 3-isopropylmalate/(R)-2-methylmalate dehydratase small subunit [Picrophilus oshimae DSM 9789]
MIKGRVWKFGDDINTDLMYPQICYTMSDDKKPLYTMSANRPGWSSMVKNGDIIIAGKNFGTGSSRPAADNLKALGISAVIAESVNGLFFRNSVNSGLLCIQCPGILNIADEPDIITIDIKNSLIINEAKNKSIKFRAIPESLMEIINAGGIINLLKGKGLLGGPL